MKDNIKIDGFDNAIIGETTNNVLIYDYNLMIKELIKNNKLDKENAEEYLEYNIIRSLQYLENAPIIANINIKPLLLDIEKCNGDTIMRCEIDLLNREIKCLNCDIADIDFNENNFYESDYLIRLQQNDECINDYEGKPSIIDLKEKI